MLAQQQQGASTHMPTNLWQPGQSGNPAGRLRGSRNKLSEEVICALLRDFREHEHKVEHRNLIKELSDEQLEAMVEYLETSLEAQARGSVRVIEGTIEPTAAEATAPPALEPPKPKNRLMLETDTAVGPRDRMPRKVRPPPGS